MPLRNGIAIVLVRSQTAAWIKHLSIFPHPFFFGFPAALPHRAAGFLCLRNCGKNSSSFMRKLCKNNLHVRANCVKLELYKRNRAIAGQASSCWARCLTTCLPACAPSCVGDVLHRRTPYRKLWSLPPPQLFLLFSERRRLVNNPRLKSRACSGKSAF